MSKIRLSQIRSLRPCISRYALLLWATAIGAAAILCAPVHSRLPESMPAPPPAPVPVSPEVCKTVAERAQPHLDWADAESQHAIDEHLATLTLFFDSAKQQTPRFARDVMGWRSKWRLVSDKLPFTRDDRHQAYLRERFGARVFTPQQLLQAVESVLTSYLTSVQSIEGMMLVRIRADVADLPAGSLPQFASPEALEQAFALALEAAAKQTEVDLRADLIRELVSIVTGEVLTMVAVRLGVSAGILATGASSSWSTFGVGLVVGVAADWVIQKVWNWWDDPAADLAGMMDARLDAIHQLLVDGDGSASGLRGKMLELHEQRRLLRRQAVHQLIEGSVQP